MLMKSSPTANASLESIWEHGLIFHFSHITVYLVSSLNPDSTRLFDVLFTFGRRISKSVCSSARRL